MLKKYKRIIMLLFVVCIVSLTCNILQYTAKSNDSGLENMAKDTIIVEKQNKKGDVNKAKVKKNSDSKQRK